ncbi:hypothetical protein HKX48_000290 [Thoreauomyces humboldtii]|nr:hypothetical protein HKX48_000290 [Thoreauomyces humboldtii]
MDTFRSYVTIARDDFSKGSLLRKQLIVLQALFIISNIIMLFGEKLANPIWVLTIVGPMAAQMYAVIQNKTLWIRWVRVWTTFFSIIATLSIVGIIAFLSTPREKLCGDLPRGECASDALPLWMFVNGLFNNALYIYYAYTMWFFYKELKQSNSQFNVYLPVDTDDEYV